MANSIVHQGKKPEDTPEKTKPGLRGIFKIYRVFGSHYKKQWHLLLIASIGMLASIGTTLLQPWPLKLILDHIILDEPFPAEASFILEWIGNDQEILLAVLAVSFIVIMFVDAMVSFVHRYYLAAASGRMTTDIRDRIFSRLHRLSLSFHSSTESGDIVYRLTSDIKDLKVVLIDGPMSVVNRVLKFSSAAAAIMLADWRLGLVAFSIVPILYFYSLRFGKGVKKATKKEKKKQSKVASIVSENVTAMALVQAYGREETEKERFELENVASVEAKVSALRLSEIFKRFADFLVAIGTSAVVFSGVLLVFSGNLLPGTIVLVVSYLKPLYSPIDKLAVLFVQMIQAQVAGERLTEFVESDMVVQDSAGAVEMPPLQGRVEFRNITFGYHAEADVIKNLSFVVEPGQTIALVGHSGAGKSTLISLLLRFYEPTQGQILLDGYDISAFKLKSLREQMTLVFQEAVLLRKTIRENIAMGKPDATDAEIERAATLAQIHEFILSLPEGYDTLIEEGGENFSGGQRQRLSIARAILRDSPILLLDEPSTGLDARAAAKVNQAIDYLTRGKTTFIIAHKFETIANADQILVLDESGLAQQGTHEVLMQISPRYQELYNLQFGGQLDAFLVDKSSPQPAIAGE